MHYTGTIWRPPYEASSLLLEVTAGCTHHKCKFCTLYDDLPFNFKMSKIEDIRSDLMEASKLYKAWPSHSVKRVFLTGANPFVLSYEKLTEIAKQIKVFFSEYETIGSFARITDISMKTDEQLLKLKKVGYDGLTIGMETADDEALSFMNKGYTSKDIVKQCTRLDQVGITYKFFYLVGISGAGKGEKGAKVTADICNQLHPKLVGANMLTIYKNSALFQEIKDGNWTEESEIEKYKEIKVLAENLNINTEFAALGASNAVQMQGYLPRDKDKMLNVINEIIACVSEEELRNYRTHLIHL